MNTTTQMAKQTNRQNAKFQHKPRFFVFNKYSNKVEESEQEGEWTKKKKKKGTQIEK